MEENRKKILVVEDEKFARDILNFTLSSEDYDISLAEDGLEALNKASSNNYDLIIMDVMMPNIDGYEACRRLKANEITKSIPIILLTGRAQKGDILKGVQAGADDYLLKPYKLQDLLNRVNKYIGPGTSVSLAQASNNSEPAIAE
ncbi:MAG: hypothetical protein A3G93_07405 [Nitrospinae bacterium RIFCSPLOWO2_12_FULL_45_22]|nr:MAG: hypothetical protein A3G93_07405 [Nitrospinae bacterium RIFCSPLOWO2_12_FULL_45_22]